MSIASEITRINSNVASAYAACNRKNALMPQVQNSAHLADTIDSIPQSSGAAIAAKDVNFYDYDGTLLHSYSAEEAAALTALPSLPSHEGLVCQGWNYTAEQIRSMYDGLSVGCNYTTDDGSTKLYCCVPAKSRITQLKICLTMEPEESATIHWGDGSSSVVTNDTVSAARKIAVHSNYTEVEEDTVLCIRIVSGRFRLGGDSVSVFGEDATSIYAIPLLQRVHIGTNCIGIFASAFQNCYSLTSITIPTSVTDIGPAAFQYCYNLKSITLPVQLTDISERTFQHCYNLSVVSIPMSVTKINARAFEDCISMKSLSIHSCVNSIGEAAFYNCTALQRAVVYAELQAVPSQFFDNCSSLMSVALPDSLPCIGNYMFRANRKLYSVVVPASVTSIGNMAFYNCSSLMKVDMTAFTDPDHIPTLANAYYDAFYNLRGKIYVANSEMLAAFRNATNWSTVPSNKFEVAEVSA